MKTDTFQETFQRLSKPSILESQTRETLSNAPYRAWKVCLSKTARLATQKLESLAVRLALAAAAICRCLPR